MRCPSWRSEGGRRVRSLTAEPTLASLSLDWKLVLYSRQAFLHNIPLSGSVTCFWLVSLDLKVIIVPGLQKRLAAKSLMFRYNLPTRLYILNSLNYSNLTMTSVSCLEPAEQLDVYRQDLKGEGHHFHSEQRFSLSNRQAPCLRALTCTAVSYTHLTLPTNSLV